MAIPTHLILGFLGAGKTTAILDLLARKPADETWAVLVNEFGEVGIDGALLAGQGAVIHEVPGGCMCCITGLPMQVGLNRLIRDARPDRLFIEPTGLGHPARILKTLAGEFYREVLEVHASIGLVDPRRLQDERVINNIHFRDQVAAADILVANKADLCSEADLNRFWQWAGDLRPARQLIARTQFGRLSRDWLDYAAGTPVFEQAHAHDHAAAQTGTVVDDVEASPWQCRENHGEGYFSVGWMIHPGRVFDPAALSEWLGSAGAARIKGVLHTADGWLAYNAADGMMSRWPVPPRDASRLQWISDKPLLTTCLDRRLRASVVT